MKVGELGEFGLISRIEGWLRAAGNSPGESGLRLGVGDDCAAWQWPPGLQLATVDTLVEGVHFTRALTDWASLGWKALAVNLSDIAAMGGEPRYGLVSLSLSPDTEVADVESFYGGMLELAVMTGTTIVGGNITAAPQFVAGVTVIGAATDGKILTRSGARIGELVAVTGYPGTAAAGLALLQGGQPVNADISEAIYRAWRRPMPRLAEGRALLRAGVSAAIDISDGIGRDLGHICASSGVGARLRAVDLPVASGVREIFGERAVNLALGGGEDYELLFTAGEELMAVISRTFDCPVTVIGEITAGDGIMIVDSEGRETDAVAEGWEHFQGD
jgi:thiamine-monophosphate kinase